VPVLLRTTRGKCKNSVRTLGGSNRGNGPHQKPLKFIGESGAPGGNRTPDHLLRRQMLYPTELRAHVRVLIASQRCVGKSDGRFPVTNVLLRSPAVPKGADNTR
jgi:hypothetical protein